MFNVELKISNHINTIANLYYTHQYTTKMDAFSDSGELYTIRNQFYTNQHNKVRGYSLDQFSSENQLKVLEYQIRSSIALEQDASKLIDEGKVKFADNEQLFQLLSAWNDLKSFGTDDSTYFDDIKKAEFELQAVLTSIYLVRQEKDIDQAINLLVEYIDSKGNFDELEPYLVLIQLYLSKGNFTSANKIFNDFQKFPDHTRDSIIYQVLESWIYSLKGETDNINNSYYFYDELLSTDFDDDNQGHFKILNVLFVLTLKLKHYPEAKELIQSINALNLKTPNGDFIANQITLDYLDNDGANVDKLLEELKTVEPEHQLIVDLNEKNDAFDEIVGKYKVSA